MLLKYHVRLNTMLRPRSKS